MELFQKIFNLISPFLYWYRYRNKNNPFRIFKRLSIDKQSDENRQKGIFLITPIRVSPISNLLEGLLGTFFRVKGYNVKYLLCNQRLCYCENISDLHTKFLRCSLCKKEQKEFKKCFNAEAFDVNDFVSNQEVDEIVEAVKQRSFESNEDFIYNGIDYKDEIESGVMRYTQKSDLDINDIKYVKMCAQTTFIISTFIINLSNKHHIYKVFTSHGIYSSWGSVLKTARSLGIDVIVWGRGYKGQGDVVFGHNKAVMDDLRSEKEDVYNNIKLDEEKIKVVKDYFLQKENPNSKVDFVNYYKGISIDDFDINGCLEKINRYKTVFGMFTNIPWDGQVFNKTDQFPTTRMYLRACMEWFIEHPDCLLVIRAHPAEVAREDSKRVLFSDLLYEEYPQLPENVIFLGPKNPISSYELFKHINCSIMYGSSMALEAAVRRIPVLHTGYMFVSNKGIVFDIFDIKDLYERFEQVRKGQLTISDEMYERALKYGYYFIMKRHIPDTSCILNNLWLERFNFCNEKEFLDEPFLNFMYDKIRTNQRLVK